MERRLAAVLIADVVGYVRLSQAYEEGTRARFQADLREVFEPAIAGHRGRLVKTMGDALLVEFHSVVDAVRCAVESRISCGSSGMRPEKRRSTSGSSSGVSWRPSQACVRTSALNMGE